MEDKAAGPQERKELKRKVNDGQKRDDQIGRGALRWQKEKTWKA